MNLIRSIVFLTLAAVVAETFGTSSIFQDENGFLAAAIPPSGSFIPTRHAGRRVHAEMMQNRDDNSERYVWRALLRSRTSRAGQK
jgi:hypothetical protein